MHQCHICSTRTREIYRIEQYEVCDNCLMQGRLEELPGFSIVVERETEATDSPAVISSWWNRKTPTGVGG